MFYERTGLESWPKAENQASAIIDRGKGVWGMGNGTCPIFT